MYGGEASIGMDASHSESGSESASSSSSADVRFAHGARVRDRSSGLRGLCKKCSDHYAPLLGELEQVRMHGAAMKRVRANHVKNSDTVRSLGQNHSARRQWL